MPINSSINLEEKIILTTCSGLMAPRDFDHYRMEVWGHRGHFGFNELFYTVEGDWSEFEFNQLLGVADKAAALISFKPNSKLALLVSIGKREELSKFYKSAKSCKPGHSRKIGIITTETEAMDWLQGIAHIE